MHMCRKLPKPSARAKIAAARKGSTFAKCPVCLDLDDYKPVRAGSLSRKVTVPLRTATGCRKESQSNKELTSKNSGFVSGHRFSDDVNSFKSEALLGAGQAFSAASEIVPLPFRGNIEGATRACFPGAPGAAHYLPAIKNPRLPRSRLNHPFLAPTAAFISPT